MIDLKPMLQVVKRTGKTLVDNSDAVLAFAAVLGAFAAVGMAIKAAPKARDKYERASDEKYERVYEERMAEVSKDHEEVHPAEIHAYAEQHCELTVKEKAEIAVKYYWPTALMLGLTTFAIIGSNRVSSRRRAALAAAYALSEANLKDFQDQILETDGKKHLEDINREVKQAQVRRDNVSDDMYIDTGHGQTRCKDDISGRYFWSDPEYIRRAVNELNRKFIAYGGVTLNEWYDELDLEHIAIGYDYIWDADQCDELLEVRFTSVLDQNDRPVLVLNYPVHPKR